MRPTILSRVLITTLAVALIAARAAFADDMPKMMPPMDKGPDPLAPLVGMIGEWEGTGTSSFGPFYCHWVAKRQGNWIVSESDIFTAKGGQQVAANSQVFGVDEQGALVVYSFDDSGMTVMHGSKDEHGGTFTGSNAMASQTATWKLNDDGSVSSHFEMHFAKPMPNYPQDFVVDETDTRVMDGGK